MRIAYVINSLEGGGAAFPVPDITRVMRQEGHEVELFALLRRDGRALPPIERTGLTVHVRDGNEKDNVAALRWLDRQVGAYRPDLLWTSLTRATAMGKLVGLKRRIPVVSWQHNAGLSKANIRLLRLLRGLTRLWVADSGCVLDFTRRRLGIPEDRVASWPIFRSNPDVPVARPWQPGDIVRVGSLGRLHRDKGYDILCAALTILKSHGALPPFEITVSGEGATRPYLESLIRDNHLTTLRLPGFNERVPEFLAGQHLYVQPSRREGLCIAMHEAMQAGLGVVASSVGEMPYTIEEGVCGHVVPPEDPMVLAEALATALHRPERLSELGQAARARVLTRFSPARFDAAGQTILQRIGHQVAA
ncbi:lipopolysaccharide glycosyl transferase [Gluconacetobacter johannae DSM 13595]|uniref:Glycosyltransferase family 4 protein n=1 Tax=Gluconacetobacter johannae TaxID=112140 RepID=A0A7W4P361_9PROT|nr:glycosyltransferase family 4 protein [Gluconacetobacter johannae]MBB2175841.1 glycosyltransferase family 4 protein [Gluconacetobacter johannae]GBQ81341.1 lipopolysaccharide glycosyl transferase [Gluconacetobacter johannae DSM 13595]